MATGCRQQGHGSEVRRFRNWRFKHQRNGMRSQPGSCSGITLWVSFLAVKIANTVSSHVVCRLCHCVPARFRGRDCVLRGPTLNRSGPLEDLKRKVRMHAAKLFTLHERHEPPSQTTNPPEAFR